MSSSSPSNRSRASSPGQLTPNAKVQALLASFDKDSDDESVSDSARARVLAALANPSRSRAKTYPERTGSFEEALTNIASALSNESTDDEEEEEEEIVRPKGRMAARMQLNHDNSEEDVQSLGNAREHVKSMLLCKNTSPEPTPEVGAISNSDEDDVFFVSKKRKLRTARRNTPKSTPSKGSASPGLFVSPSANKSAAQPADDDSDLDLPAANDDRFAALVQKKREERLAREAVEAKEKASKIAEQRKQARDIEEDDDDISDDAERRLTQPTRKASKKAQEEIRRETQRMSRNQQLAHNAVTKKKYKTSTFLARFNYGTKKDASDLVQPASSSSPARQTDVEMRETPPTSPASPSLDKAMFADYLELPPVVEHLEEDKDDLPKLEDALKMRSSLPPRLDKGKGRAIEEPTHESEMPKQKSMFTQRPVHIRAPNMEKTTIDLDGSDSDLEIVKTKSPNRQKKKMNAIFDRIPVKHGKESSAMYAQRMLACVKTPPKKAIGKNNKPSITTGELQLSLQQRARQQAAREREERLQDLRKKGVHIPTAEERQKEMADVEDMLANARREGEEIMKREKEAAKKERKANGGVDPQGDSSDDEDWEENEISDAEFSVSGSDDEDNDDGDTSGQRDEDEEEAEKKVDGNETATVNSMFDNEASESEGEEQADLTIPGEPLEAEEFDGEEQLPVNQLRRRYRGTVISDDEDGDENFNATEQSVPATQSPVQLHTDSPGAPTSVLRSATKTFIPGVTVAGPAGLGLTQIFAGTMDDSQVDDEEVSQSGQIRASQNRGLDFLRRMPAPELPEFFPTMEEDTQAQDAIMESQPGQADGSQHFDSIPPHIELNFSQSQMYGFDSLVQDSQMSQIPDATQDLGFQNVTPIRGRFMEAPPSTVDTVVLNQSAVPEISMETPVKKKKGKLRQRNRVASFSDEEEVDGPSRQAEEEFDITSAFEVMRKASKKKKAVVGDFDKKNSKAKDMVQEQADESEDEYAGLGGVSDDESGGEVDDLVEEMIDDDCGKDIDERELAAFYADRERASDSRAVEKLYKDITNGTLRRKRGADYDLSDSDDGGEARKKRKRAEFAKMRKALLSDERIGKIAENPKREAFVRAIEDRNSDDDMDFLDDFVETEGTDSQSQTQGEDLPQIIPNSQPTEMGPPPRKSFDNPNDRAPSNLRRTKPAKKPANLSEIRASLSSLIEVPNSMVQTVDLSSDSEDGLDIEVAASKEPGRGKENRDPFVLRRTGSSVIDRISLKRQSSSSISTSTRLAFSASSAANFKVPALLRKATSNSFASSESSSGMERTTGVNGAMKKNASKNSGVNYFARENERRAGLMKGERKREMKKVKKAEGRRAAVGGLLGGGKFE